MGWGPEPADMSGSNEAARSGAVITREQWDWNKARQPKIDAQTDEMIKIGKDQYALNREGQVFQQGLMKKQDDRYWNSIAPMEDQYFADANNFDTNAKREELAGMAMADVNQGFSSARDQGTRAMARMGVNPNSGRAIALNNQTDIAQATASANAMNKTRTAARLEGLGRKTDAIAMGKGLSGFNSSTLANFGAGAQGAAGLGMNGLYSASGQYNAAANGASGGFQSAAQNLRANAIESAKNPTFDAMMGLASGGMQAWGMKR